MRQGTGPRREGRRTGGRRPWTNIFLALAVLTLAAGCSAGPPESGPPANRQSAEAVQRVGDVSVTLTTTPAVAFPGGTFALTLVVRNLSEKKLEYRLPTGQTYEFKAFVRHGEEVWRWSRGMYFIQKVNALVLEPGGSTVYKVAWNTGAEPPGLYTVQGCFLGLPGTLPAVSVEIERAGQ